MRYTREVSCRDTVRDQVVPESFCTTPKPPETLQCPAIRGPVTVIREASVSLAPSQIVNGAAGFADVSSALGRMPSSAALSAFTTEDFVFRLYAGSRTAVTVQLSDLRTQAGAFEVRLAAGTSKKLVFWRSGDRWIVLV
jgi:hypothetical protein